MSILLAYCIIQYIKRPQAFCNSTIAIKKSHLKYCGKLGDSLQNVECRADFFVSKIVQFNAINDKQTERQLIPNVAEMVKTTLTRNGDKSITFDHGNKQSVMEVITEIWILEKTITASSSQSRFISIALNSEFFFPCCILFVKKCNKIKKKREAKIG